MTPLIPLSDGPPPAFDTIPSRSPAPVLIQVPTLAARSIPKRPAARPIRAGRRRLRREVRVACSALAFALPMSWAMVSLGRFAPDPEKPAAVRLSLTTSLPAPADGGPLATISLDSAATAVEPEAESPAARPSGYLLPAEANEDSTHAGN